MLRNPARSITDIKDYYHSGVWTNFSGYGESGPVCGMNVQSHDRAIYIKYFGDKDILAVQFFKTTWRIPEGTKITVELGFDKNSWGTNENAYGSTLEKGGMGEIYTEINSDSFADFLEQVAAANTMWVQFPDGNEDRWNANMEGSRNSVNSFLKCIEVMKKVTTQPYANGSKSSQPSQPFSDSKSSEPFGAKPTAEDVKSSRNKI